MKNFIYSDDSDSDDIVQKYKYKNKKNNDDRHIIKNYEENYCQSDSRIYKANKNIESLKLKEEKGSSIESYNINTNDNFIIKLKSSKLFKLLCKLYDIVILLILLVGIIIFILIFFYGRFHISLILKKKNSTSLHKKNKNDKIKINNWNAGLNSNKLLPFAGIKFMKLLKNPCTKFYKYICGDYKKKYYEVFYNVQKKMSFFIKKTNQLIKLNDPYFKVPENEINTNMKKNNNEYIKYNDNNDSINNHIYDSENDKNEMKKIYLKLNYFYTLCNRCNKKKITEIRMREVKAIIEKLNKNKTNLNEILFKLILKGFQPLFYFYSDYILKEKHLYSSDSKKFEIIMDIALPTLKYNNGRRLNKNNMEYLESKYSNVMIKDIEIFYLKLTEGFVNCNKQDYEIMNFQSINNVYSNLKLNEFMKSSGLSLNSKINTIYSNKLKLIKLLSDFFEKNSLKKIKLFLLFYTMLGIQIKWKHNFSQGCINYIHLYFPTLYCKFTKHYIGYFDSKIKKIEGDINHMIQEYKSYIKTKEFKNDFGNKFNLKINNNIWTHSLKKLNTLFVNVARCQNRHWENLIINVWSKPKYNSTSNLKSLFSVEMNANIKIKKTDFNNMFIKIIKDLHSKKSFRIHRINLLRNSDQNILHLGTKRLYHMIYETSPRYNMISHELILPIQMLLSPIINSKYIYSVQYSFFTFFIMHELTHVIQKSLKLTDTINVLELEKQADILGFKLTLRFLKRFGVNITKEIIINILQIWCKLQTSESHHGNHLSGENRIMNILNYDYLFKNQFKNTFYCVDEKK